MPSTTTIEATNNTSNWTMRRLLAGRPGAGLGRRDAAFVSLFFATRKKQYTNSRESTRPMNECLVVLTTMPADDRADALARTLIDEQLAACVNVHAPMTSTYRWRGAVEVESERQVVIKT